MIVCYVSVLLYFSFCTYNYLSNLELSMSFDFCFYRMLWRFLLVQDVLRSLYLHCIETVKYPPDRRHAVPNVSHYPYLSMSIILF